MKLWVNGEEQELESMSVADYLGMLDMDPHPLAVELNRVIISKCDYQSTILGEGDRLEIVWFVGGG